MATGKPAKKKHSAPTKATRSHVVAEPAHTADHRNCPACEKAGEVGQKIEILSHHTFSTGADVWLKDLQFDSKNPYKSLGYISRRTLQDYQYYIQTLNKWFKDIPLGEVSLGNIRSYQEHRSATADANKINSEVAILRRIMQWAHCWTDELETHYQPLQSSDPDIPRALSPDQQTEFLRVAGSRSEWELVYWYSRAALKTTLTNCEMTGLKRGDIQFKPVPILQVRNARAKNKYRVRTVALGDDAIEAFTWLADRAWKLGADGPQHYIFPFREKRNQYDCTRPMTNSGIKKPFDEVRRAAGVPWLRIHDLRHTAITRLAEAGTPIPTIMSMAGHITTRMLQHYTHISEHAQRMAQNKASIHRAPPVRAPESDNEEMMRKMVDEVYRRLMPLFRA